MDDLTKSVRMAWDADLAAGGEFWINRSNLDALIRAEANAVSSEGLVEFVGILPLPENPTSASAYFELDEDQPEAVMHAAVLLSTADTLAEITSPDPAAVALILDRQWPEADGDFFWEEWEQLVLSIRRWLCASSESKTMMWVKECEWAAVCAALDRETSIGVLEACISRPQWLDPTAKSLARAAVSLHPGLPQSAYKELISTFQGLDWYWAAQLLPLEDVEGEVMSDVMKWDTIQELIRPFLTRFTTSDSWIFARFAADASAAHAHSASAFMVEDETWTWDASPDVLGAVASPDLARLSGKAQ